MLIDPTLDCRIFWWSPQFTRFSTTKKFSIQPRLSHPLLSNVKRSLDMEITLLKICITNFKDVRNTCLHWAILTLFFIIPFPGPTTPPVDPLLGCTFGMSRNNVNCRDPPASKYKNGGAYLCSQIRGLGQRNMDTCRLSSILANLAS